jgi:sugar lactone lactonase YvrE
MLHRSRSRHARFAIPLALAVSACELVPDPTPDAGGSIGNTHSDTQLDSGFDAAESARDAASPESLDAAPANVVPELGDARADASRAATDAVAATDAADVTDAVGRDPDANTRDAHAALGEPCPDGFARGLRAGQARRIAALNPGPEGVGVCPNGDVFAGAEEVLWRIPLDGGAPERFATLTGRSLESIVCDAQGRIFVADISATGAWLTLQEPAFPPAIVLLEGKDRPPQAIVANLPGHELTGFNGLIELPGLGFYATDMLAGLIVRFVERSPGQFETSLAADELPYANGLAYDPKRRILYVSATGLWFEPDQVLTFHMNDDGTLSERQVIWTSEAGEGVDGLVIDENGEVYQANQIGGTITRTSDQAVVGMVPNPASLAFRGGTLFATDFKTFGVLQNGGEGGIYALDLGVCRGPLR